MPHGQLIMGDGLTGSLFQIGNQVRQEQILQLAALLADQMAVGHGIAEVTCVHADEVVVGIIIALFYLDGAFAGAGDANRSEFFSGGWVDGVADGAPDFLGAGGGGGDVEAVGEVMFADEIF